MTDTELEPIDMNESRRMIAQKATKLKEPEKQREALAKADKPSPPQAAGYFRTPTANTRRKRRGIGPQEIKASIDLLEADKADHLSKKKYTDYLILFDGHKRFEPFLAIHEQMPDADYWRCVNLVWSNIEVSAPDQRAWLTLFTSRRGQREKLMTRKEHKALAALPEQFRIYRGYAKGRARKGLSWTLRKAVALQFARYATGGRRALLCGHKANGPGMVVTGLCFRKDVLAYFTGRNEAEIVIDPDKVRIIHARNRNDFAAA